MLKDFELNCEMIKFVPKAKMESRRWHESEDYQ